MLECHWILYCKAVIINNVINFIDALQSWQVIGKRLGSCTISVKIEQSFARMRFIFRAKGRKFSLIKNAICKSSSEIHSSFFFQEDDYLRALETNVYAQTALRSHFGPHRRRYWNKNCTSKNTDMLC